MWSERHYVGFLMKHGRKLGHITHDSFFPPFAFSSWYHCDDILHCSQSTQAQASSVDCQLNRLTNRNTTHPVSSLHKTSTLKTLSSEMERERGEPKAIKDSQLKWNSSLELKHFKYIKAVKFVTHLAILMWVFWLMPCYCYYSDVKCDIVIVSTVTT